MPKTDQERLDDAVVAIAELCDSLDVGHVEQITIYLQAGVELPYQVSVREEEVPLAGLATIEAWSNSRAATTPAKRTTSEARN